eukprot:NODE_101_length_2126_cov_516.460647.p1 GENE.NODE_101_length_2126_cov_516.460647~~NODE_101_length_2126_cov_516.460647.p1  ORF type:complete len:635 (+),score=274.27 NODE_101_length_2126_cov_516.460647:42-1946(+)
MYSVSTQSTWEVLPVQDDDIVIKSDTADRVIRPKREVACVSYKLEEQKDHCLEICALSYSVFSAVILVPQSLYKNTVISRPADYDRNIYTSSHWQAARNKIFDHFVDSVQKSHNNKYLHFLFGQIEVVRGSRLQRSFFLVPRQIRVLKDNTLVHGWQEDLLLRVERSSPEAQIDDFAERVLQYYVSFVRHQYSLLSKPWPFNRAGEVISFCIKLTMVTTVVINGIMLKVYGGSYSDHSVTVTNTHYPNHLSVHALSCVASVHLFFSIIWVTFYMLTKSGWIMDTGIEEWREVHRREEHKLNNAAFRSWLKLQYFLSDTQLIYNLGLLLCSFLGLYVNFLFNAVNMYDLCQRSPILQKVIESITSSWDLVAGTMFLGFCLQYAFVSVSFMIFGKGYGFADKNTSGCATLEECLMAHFDYGFRSAPVWPHDPTLTASRFFFDYMYNLIVILIMAAIISGIIIDNFTELREKHQTILEDMHSKCFICSLTKAELERKSQKFENHILRDHYMWSYARFLLYLEEINPAMLSGPESYVKQKIKDNNMGFFPISRCIAFETSDVGEEHLEREVRVKDFDDCKNNISALKQGMEETRKTSQAFHTETKELKESMQAAYAKVQALQKQMLQEDDTQKKAKKR